MVDGVDTASLPYPLRAEGSWQYQPFGRPSSCGAARRATGGGRVPGRLPARGRRLLLGLRGLRDAVQDNGRAIVVGETTGGSTGQPYMLDLGDGMQAIVGAKREMFPDGGRFEGVGVRPDVEVLPTVDDLRSGRDVVLEAARQRLLVDDGR
jgi:hypothetical protein